VALRTAGRGFETTFETMVFRILRGASLPLPVVQYWIQTAHGLRRIDMAYPDVKVALEPEGFAGHASRRQFDTDRVKRTDLDEMGWTVVQVTYTVALLRPLEIAISVGNALGLQPARWRNANPRRRRRPRDR
jgi:very-short-patch-repair endonuclease